MKYSRRIIVKFVNAFPIPYLDDKKIRPYLRKNYPAPWKTIFKNFPGITIAKLFSSTSELEITDLVAQAAALDPNYTAAPRNFLNYFAIDCDPKTKTYQLLSALSQVQDIEMSYMDEPATVSTAMTGANPLSKRQGYLDPAPKGIDARFAWTVNGGCGEGPVKFIDLEYAWVLNHEDIINANVKFLWGYKQEKKDRDHGTSVLGILLMQDNNVGGIGVTHKLKNAQTVSIVNPGGRYAIHDATMKAISSLNFGDVLLFEIQRYNKRLQKFFGSAKTIFWPIELDEAMFKLIELATSKGIIVIEPAANGTGVRGYNLNKVPDSNGKMILDVTSLDFKNSGAIMVGAANDKVRLNKHGKKNSSNYGNRIDCYAWGRNAYTADDPSKKIYKPTPHKRRKAPYTKFTATSCASAIIAGVAIAIQSIREASGKSPLSPTQMRQIFRNSSLGTPSVKNRIGTMPDLRKIIPTL